MQNSEIIQNKLQPALEECRLHQQRLHQAWTEALEFEAFAANAAQSQLTEAQVRITDQLVFRFGRLQDAMGTRLLPAMLQLTQEWVDNEAFIDKLNRAEKIGLIPSTEQWQMLREYRNQTAHEYPSRPELVIANLKQLVASVPLLEKILSQLQQQAQQRIGTFKAEFKST